MDELEEPDTKKLFLEQGSWETKQRKEMQEYLDAKNQEVTTPTPGLTALFFLPNIQEVGGDCPQPGVGDDDRGRRH